jgi:hypothetical protein
VPEVAPQVILRLGSHAEKEYVEKTVRYFDGVMVGANLLQATPGATASLLLKLHRESGRPYYIDPMTYAFGAYVDPESGRVRDDLDWIKSVQKVRGGRKGQTKRDFKSSYRKLADVFGPPFSEALRRGTAVSSADFLKKAASDSACEAILKYQAETLRDVFREDPETKPFADELPAPAAVFAPYFYIEKSQAESWIELNGRLVASSVEQQLGIPVHAVICGHRDLLTDRARSALVVKNLLACKPSGVWLWFSRFDEHDATRKELLALRSWVEELSPTMPVLNMHGGFYSLALSRFGMAGIAHGVGYGEQKDVVPVIGQSTPTVQYYVRPLHAKFSVPEIERCFTALGVTNPEEFFLKICGCAICRGILSDNLSAFKQFGEIHYSTPSSRRAAQTPAAAKRCRFHFLLNRILERDYVRRVTSVRIAEDCVNSAERWSATTLPAGSLQHLSDWAQTLGNA